MRLPPPPSPSDSHFYVSGNVTIHPSAAIAPSVMLQADPDSQLIVAAGVCIGVGTVLHAHQGLLIMEPGVTLGSGVLVVGRGSIGANTCIGSCSTIIDSSVPANQSLPPGSLIGDQSRPVVTVEATGPYKAPDAPAPPVQPSSAAPSPPESPPEQPAEPAAAPASPTATTRVVYGRTYLERMMITMFPHRQALDPPTSE